MPRQPELRKKKVGKSVYWFTGAGGDTYFGRADDVSHRDARKMFADHPSRIRTVDGASKGRGLTAGALMDAFLDWVHEHRSGATYDTRRNYCSRFGAFHVGTRRARVAYLPADHVRGEDLEAWLAHLAAEGLGDQLRSYYATGARTDELALCRVEDFLPRTRQVVLGRHKRSRTQRVRACRQVTLNGEALAVFGRHCEGRQPADYVFVNADGRPWNARSLAKRFVRVKEVAAGLGLGAVRDAVTLYDFRHLWISEALMASNDVATVARMAGTRIAMLERVYGHFRNQHLHDAQERLDRLRQRRGRRL